MRLRGLVRVSIEELTLDQTARLLGFVAVATIVRTGKERHRITLLARAARPDMSVLGET